MEKRIITSGLDLDVYLNEIFKERMETDFIGAVTGNPSGTLDNKKFIITFCPNKYAVVSMEKDSTKEFNELIGVINQVMNDEPICSYDLKEENLEDALPTYEWDTDKPEDRIKEIVNGRAFSDKSKVLNLNLFGNRKIEDYLETKEQAEERIKNARIYGIDPGKDTNVELIASLSEADLYLAIDAVGGLLWRIRHEVSHGRMEPTDTTELQYRIEYLVYQTRKFGVDIPDAKIDCHVEKTPSYLAWYRFYDNHFKNELTDEEWNEFINKKDVGEDVSNYLPTGSWKDTLEEGKKRERK